MTDSPSWSHIKGVFQSALEREPAARAAFLHEACAGNETLRKEVESLLAAFDQAGSFVERPAIASLTSSAARGARATLANGGRALQAGDSLGPYEIRDFIGAGGMGEVYRAHDSKLHRDVALKIRSGVFALDPDRLARVTREAQLLASLNHPNIAAIYGLEESGEMQALVLEHVEGQTLAQRLTQGAVPSDEALPMAVQIARGLAAAHERGIVHRDLKPANIKLRPDGTVKILDFGLAKAFDLAHPTVDSAPVTAASPDITSAGTVVGTASYMSPEQARGKTVDKRTDIWAFGCVLYEVLTGRPAFRGASVEDTLAAVVSWEPDWSALPIDTPSTVVTALRRCLEKDPTRRWHDISDVKIEIEDAASNGNAIVGSRRNRLVSWALAGIAVTAVATAVWAWRRPAAESVVVDRTVRRLQVRLPETESLAAARVMPLGLGQPSIAISPDGERIAYVLEHEGVRRLYVRELDQLEGAPLARTEGAFGPFFSPDGRWIGFFAENKIKKIAIAGGEPVPLCPAPNPYGGSWGPSGTILFSTDEGRRPMQVREAGGPCEYVPMKDARGAWTHPDILPGGKAAIVSNPLLGVGVLSLETGEFRPLVERASGGRYASSGHLVFARGGALHAMPFDLKRLTVREPASVVVEGIRMEGQVAAVQAVFSRDGTLIYAPGVAANDATRPVWVDRQGTVRPVGMPPKSYRSFSLSPDGTRLAIAIADGDTDIWLQDLARGTLMRLTSGGNNVQPKWTPDGSRIMFASIVDGRRTAFWVTADGSSAPELAPAGGNSISPDGTLIVFIRREPETAMDLWVRPFKKEGSPELFLRTPFTEVGPQFSPDGRYISYVSDESGQYEVYVRPYPAGPGKWQVSTRGGEEAMWSNDGRELFYRNGNTWMAVAVDLELTFKAGAPRRLFEGPYVNVGGISYDVTPDGQRFLVLEPAGPAAAPVTHLNVVLNWFEEMKEKAGTPAQ